MQRAKAFYFVCAGVFLLALSYHLGAQSAGAQAPGNPVVGIVEDGLNPGGLYAITAGGNCCQTGNGGNTWSLRGNVFGGPVPAQSQSFGALKSRYRGTPGATQAPTQDR